MVVKWVSVQVECKESDRKPASKLIYDRCRRLHPVGGQSGKTQTLPPGKAKRKQSGWKGVLPSQSKRVRGEMKSSHGRIEEQKNSRSERVNYVGT